MKSAPVKSREPSGVGVTIERRRKNEEREERSHRGRSSYYIQPDLHKYMYDNHTHSVPDWC